jgi:uracil permease
MKKTERKPIPPEGIRNAYQDLGLGRTLLLGLQHMFAMFGATILVPILVGNYFGMDNPPIQVTLFFAGFGTLFFHACTKMKVPAFLGSSFAFLGGFAGVANLNSGIYANLTGIEKYQYACGGVVIAGLLYLVLALVMKLVGVKRVIRFLPPVVTGPIIILIGLSLAPSAVSNASTNWLLALVALGIIIVCNIWGKGMIKIIPILLGVVGSYLFALILQFGLGVTNPDGSVILDFSSAAACASQGIAGFINLPDFRLAKFDLTSILVMAPIAIATMMEHIGDISSISATVGENFVEDPGLQRTLVGDGVATAVAALFGGPANTTYGENTGVLELSKVYDPWVIRLAAIYAIVLSFSPVVARIIGSIPSSIIGGVSFMLYGMISAIGVRNVVENQVDFRNSRNLIVAALILVTGLGFSDGISFTVGTTSITLTSLALAAIVGIVANAILPGKDYIFSGKNEAMLKTVKQEVVEIDESQLEDK